MPPDLENTEDSCIFKSQESFPEETTNLIGAQNTTDISPSKENLASLETSTSRLGSEYGQSRSYLRFWSKQGSLSRQDDRLVVAMKRQGQPIAIIRTAVILSFTVVALSILYILAKDGASVGPEADDYQRPFSTLDPMQDLGLPEFHHSTKPSFVLNKYMERYSHKRAIPTNAWYQNFLLLNEGAEPSLVHRAYAIPYVVDAAGPIPGLRMFTTHMIPTSNVLQLDVKELLGITMGVAPSTMSASMKWNKVYSVQEMTQLAVSLSWVSCCITRRPIVVEDVLQNLTLLALLLQRMITECPAPL